MSSNEYPTPPDDDIQEQCKDTNIRLNGIIVRDLNGNGCDQYALNLDWCGNYDSKAFIAAQMCCACGGGDRDSSIEDEEGPSAPIEVNCTSGTCTLSIETDNLDSLLLEFN